MGPMAKPHRMFLLTGSLVVEALFGGLFGDRTVVTFALWIILLGSAITCVLRTQQIAKDVIARAAAAAPNSGHESPVKASPALEPNSPEKSPTTEAQAQSQPSKGRDYEELAGISLAGIFVGLLLSKLQFVSVSGSDAAAPALSASVESGGSGVWFMFNVILFLLVVGSVVSYLLDKRPAPREGMTELQARMFTW